MNNIRFELYHLFYTVSNTENISKVAEILYIRAKANRLSLGNAVVNLATNKEDAKFCFEHARWKQIKRIVVETIDF